MEKFDEYQQATKEFALYPKEVAVLYTTCGLVGEASEAAEKVMNYVCEELQAKGSEQLELFGETDEGKNITYFLELLGTITNTGRKLEKFKKQVRKGELKLPVFKEMTDKQKSDLKFECGDQLWYLSELATSLGLNLSDIAKSNIVKLDSRKVRNVLHGQGDNR